MIDVQYNKLVFKHYNTVYINTKHVQIGSTAQISQQFISLLQCLPVFHKEMFIIVNILMLAWQINWNLFLAKCKVCMASYGPYFFPSFYGPGAKHMGHENKEGKNEDS